MSNIARMMQRATAGAGGAGPDVEEVFSTYLWGGTGSARNIVNDINMADNGGLVWIKSRTEGGSQYDGFHILCDSERGANKTLNSDGNKQENWTSFGNTVTGFNNTNGFSIGDSDYVNYNGHAFASWTFRKAPKFFDVVTWSGNGTAGRTIAHNIGSAPGMILVKDLGDADNSWNVYHRAASGTPQNSHLELDNSNAVDNSGNRWNNTSPTSAVFSVGNSDKVNASGHTYVAYLFAHNNNDGEFGPDGDADIIKCGSYTGNGSTTGPVIDLGFEPQWLMVKRSDSADEWFIFDVMRGFDLTTTARLSADSSNAESPSLSVIPTSTGFQPVKNHGSVNGSGGTYIYMAIRRGTKVPESATEVFDVESGNGNGSASSPEFVSGFPVDAALIRSLGTANNQLYSRLTANKYLSTDQTDAEITNASDFSMASNEGWYLGSTTWTSWMWKRAPGYFDAVAYSGTGTERGVPHNLGVTPEMAWIKARDFAGKEWFVHHTGLTSWAKVLQLQSTGTESSGDTGGNLPTATTFPVNASSNVNGSGYNYIAYLFASLPGISKVGSYTGNGTSQNIDCGFTSGARFVLIKNASQSDNWMVYDSVRGIVSGNDPYLRLNSTAAEYTSGDHIDPYSGGFAATSNDPSTNRTGNTYIFYAIA